MRDTIYRQDAIDAVADGLKGIFVEYRDIAEKMIGKLPSAKPEVAKDTNVHNNDCISRQTAIDALDVLCQEHRYRIPGKRETYSQYNEAWQDALDRAEGAIGNLPSAQPERKKGMWIKLDMHAHIADHKCTACGEECYVPTCMGEPMYTYCPNCGAYMNER